MSSQDIGQWFRVSRGGCWQCVPDCRSQLAEVLTFFQVAYNVEACRSAPVRWACVEGRIEASVCCTPPFHSLNR